MKSIFSTVSAIILGLATGVSVGVGVANVVDPPVKIKYQGAATKAPNLPLKTGKATANVESALLTEGVDNQPALQSFLDSLAPGSIVMIPEGSWSVASTLNVPPGIRVEGAGMDATEIVALGELNGPVVGWGGGGRWANSAGRTRSDGVTITKMTLRQTAGGNTNDKCLWGETGHDATISFVRFKGSNYEGGVSGNWNERILVEDCVAEDCGNGGPAYSLSTAGINFTSQTLILRRLKTVRCGQGIEAGAVDVDIEDCEITEPTSATPSIGINIGSTGAGIHNLNVRRNFVAGYPSSFQCANGIGRLSKIAVEDNVFLDGAVSFAGGKPTNNTPHPDGGDGPDTFGSIIQRNTLIATKPNVVSIMYNTGPSPAYQVYGREPLRIERNTITYVLSNPALQTTPPLAFAGLIDVDCTAVENKIFGLDAASSRGDVASFTSGTNPAVPAFPKLRVAGNRAYTKAGAARAVSVKIEGAP